MPDLYKRLITGVIGIIILALVIYFRAYLLTTFLCLLGILASIEISMALRKIDINANIIVLIIGCIILAASSYLNIEKHFAITFVLILTLMLLLFDDKFDLNSLAYTNLIFIYAPYLFSLISDLSTPFIIMIFLIAFSTDTFAYIFGSLFGKHKLIEKVSPKKSIEGAVGGIIGCLALTLAYLYFHNINIDLSLILLIIFASTCAQLGDLFASKIKRIVGIKDYSNLLPGHGGIMDRFDSVIMVIPVVTLISILYL